VYFQAFVSKGSVERFDEAIVRWLAGSAATSVLTALNVSFLVFSFPLVVCVLIAILSFLKWIEEDKPDLESADPERDSSWITNLCRPIFRSEPIHADLSGSSPHPSPARNN
jgi:choline-glycine betaine transporter